jgi:hypothetical protein
MDFYSIVNNWRFFVAGKKNKKRIIGFIIWIIANIGWVVFNFYFHYYSVVCLYSVYTVQATLGIANNIEAINDTELRSK